VTFKMTQKVLFKHCDPAGIVFYPRYFEIINDAVEAFFGEAINAPFEDMHTTHGVPTVEIKSKFTAVSRHGDVLSVAVVPTRIGGASLDLSLIATCDGEVRFDTNLTLVYVRKDMTTQQWPDAIRAALASHLPLDTKDIAHG
jgi:4-hydroxybenzoyl-CoA thioesterase